MGQTPADSAPTPGAMQTPAGEAGEATAQPLPLPPVCATFFAKGQCLTFLAAVPSLDKDWLFDSAIMLGYHHRIKVEGTISTHSYEGEFEGRITAGTKVPASFKQTSCTVLFRVGA